MDTDDEHGNASERDDTKTNCSDVSFMYESQSLGFCHDHMFCLILLLGQEFL